MNSNTLARHGQARDMNIWMSVGQLDILLEDNRKMHALLQDKKYNATNREFSGVHNYTAWRYDIWTGLDAMFLQV